MSLIPAYLFGRPFVPEIGNWESPVQTNLQVGSYAMGWSWGFGFVAQGGSLYQIDMDVASIGYSGRWNMALYSDDGDSPGGGIATPTNSPATAITSGTWSWHFSQAVPLARDCKYWLAGNFSDGGYGYMNCVVGKSSLLSGRMLTGGYPSEVTNGQNMSGYDFRFRALFK